MASFDAQQKLEALVTNDTTPSMPTIDILSSLKLIEHWEGKTKDANPADPSAKIAKEEFRLWLSGGDGYQLSAQTETG